MATPAQDGLYAGHFPSQMVAVKARKICLGEAVRSPRGPEAPSLSSGAFPARSRLCQTARMLLTDASEFQYREENLELRRA